MKGKVTSRGGVRSSHFSTEGVSDTPCPRLTFANSPSQNFADPLTEVLRNGARALLAQAIEAEVPIAVPPPPAAESEPEPEETPA